MAITHGDGKAGQFAKRTAFQKFVCIHRLELIVMLTLGMMLAYLSVAMFRFHWLGGGLIGNWPVFAISGAILIVIYLGYRPLDKYLDQLAKERINWLRGGQGEALVAWRLNELPDTWHVFHNIKIQDNGDLDHVLIGPGGLFCISTKASRGLYTMESPGKYQLNGEATDHVAQAQRLAMQLKDGLANHLDKLPWIQPVLIAPLAYIGFNTYQKQAWVLHEENLPEVFEKVPVKLKAADIIRCVNAIRSIAEQAPGP